MSIASNLQSIRERIANACDAAGRPEGEVALMGVSKLHPPEALLEAYEAGLRLFGENRVQEWQEKRQSLHGVFPDREAAGGTGAKVHLIGPLQSNKTKRAAELFDSVDAVDSVKIATRLNSAAADLGRKLPILIEVKLSHEPSKHGILPEDLGAALKEIASLPAIVARGLMTVPPWSEVAEDSRPYFRRLRELRQMYVGEYPTLMELSMGMSNDFEVAIEEGSTCVRVGTALFGRRTPMPGVLR